MKVLVPGGAGYIGAVLVPWLLADGHEVTVYDMMWFGRGHLPENGSLKIIKADIRSLRDINAACEGQDAVICLASISAEEMCQRNPVLARTVNMGGAMSVAISAKNAGIRRFIYASSVAAYASSDKPSSETDEMRPTTIYGECKVDAERRVRESFPEAVIVRCASVCGYSPHQRFDLTVNMMVHDAMRKGVITVNGGEQKRSHIHIQDVCDFYRLLLDVPERKISGQIFNVAAVNETVVETANLVAKETGAAVLMQPRSDNRSYKVDGAKAFEVLGYKPRRTIRQAVLDLKARFDAGNWPDSMTNQAYMNLANIIGDGLV